MVKKTLVVLIAAAALAGCGPKANETTPAATASAPAVSATNAPAHGDISGTVLETVDAAGYTYIRIKTAAGERWAVVTQTKLDKGANVTVHEQMTADKFTSKSLNRTFEHIVFGNLAGEGGAAGPSPHATPAAPQIDLASIKVDKATGSDAKTIAEIWAAKSLKDAPVTVRGKVVKFLPSIMGKNWMHIRDGSGSDKSGDNDVAVTTADNAAVGDVVTVKGTVRRDKDFGAGYTYPVIIEDAKLTK